MWLCHWQASESLRSLILENPSNYCYANTWVFMLLSLGDDLDRVLVPRMCSVLRTVLKRGRCILRQNFMWSAQLIGWSNPQLQHDFAEFVMHTRRFVQPSQVAQWGPLAEHGDPERLPITGTSWPLTIAATLTLDRVNGTCRM